MTAKPKPAQDGKGRFLPGNNGGAGRPKGARNRLSEAFLEALAADFDQHGPAVIEAVRLEKPDQYLKVVASLLPKDINVSVNEFDGMTDAELVARIHDLDEFIRPLIYPDEDGAGGAEGTKEILMPSTRGVH